MPDPFGGSILITGGGGMLAHALDRALRARGHTPVALGRAACDLTNPGHLDQAFRAHRPAVLLNCAAYTKVDLCEEQPDLADAVNGFALEHLAGLAKSHGTTLVHFSTDFVFDGRSARPYLPHDPTNPLSAYGRSKLLGERMVRRVGPPGWLVVRTAWLYGPGGPSFPQTMLTLARQGVPLRVVSDQVGSPTYTADLADATLDLVDRRAAGVWHLANAGQTSWFDFAAAILDEFGVAGGAGLTPTTSEQWKASRPKSATRPQYSVLDTSAYAALAGRPMRPWREALRAYRSAVEPTGG